MACLGDRASPGGTRAAVNGAGYAVVPGRSGLAGWSDLSYHGLLLPSPRSPLTGFWTKSIPRARKALSSDAAQCMKAPVRGKYLVTEHAVELRRIIPALPIV